MAQQRPTVWYGRFTSLRSAGLSFEQATAVYSMLESGRLFGTQTIADSAWTSLLRAYDRDES
jgi:hypothetical protein